MENTHQENSIVINHLLEMILKLDNRLKQLELRKPATQDGGNY
jgi:hypothetical protein